MRVTNIAKCTKVGCEIAGSFGKRSQRNIAGKLSVAHLCSIIGRVKKLYLRPTCASHKDHRPCLKTGSPAWSSERFPLAREEGPELERKLNGLTKYSGHASADLGGFAGRGRGSHTAYAELFSKYAKREENSVAHFVPFEQ